MANSTSQTKSDAQVQQIQSATKIRRSALADGTHQIESDAPVQQMQSATEKSDAQVLQLESGKH
jgi:hypothetical protein